MIKIVVDSTCDLSPEILKKYNINMIPLNVHFGETTYKDGIDLTPESFYKMLKTNPIHPKTSQPSPEDFKKMYTRLLQDGSEVISLHISSKMSGTVQSATIAKNELKSDKIHLIDSENVSIPLGLIAIECSRAIDTGQDITTILGMVDNLKNRIRIYFIVDTLEYLQKGGRIGKAAAIIGGLLHIKPILMIKDGSVCPFEKVRGTDKVFARLSDIFKEFINQHNSEKIVLSFAHASDYELLQQLMNKINNFYNCSNAFITEIGPVVGTHAGPGTLGICFYRSL